MKLIRLVIVFLFSACISILSAEKVIPTDKELIDYINTETTFCECDYKCIEVFDRNECNFRATFKNKYSGFVYIMYLKYFYKDSQLKIDQR